MPAEFLKNCSQSVYGKPPIEVIIHKVSKSVDIIIDELAPKVKDHYLNEESVQKILKRWGREKLAIYMGLLLPVTKKGRSGHLGEILATEYVNYMDFGYEIPIKRLRWKDGRDCAMRGEDIMGFMFDKKPMGFIKGEVKSRKALTSTVVDEARKGLEKNSGLPQPHTLVFIAERLAEIKQDKKAEQIQEYILNKLPDKTQVAHLIFTFSGNDPSGLLQNDVKKVRKGVTHYSVGFFVDEHQKLIEDVFQKAQSV